MNEAEENNAEVNEGETTEAEVNEAEVTEPGVTEPGVTETGGIAGRLRDVLVRIAACARANGRDPSSVRLVAVTKKLPAAAALEAYEAGHRDFGENYVQEGAAKAAELAAQMPDARWHLIGRLQSNKAAVAVRAFSLLHGIDSLSTSTAVAKAAIREGRTVDALLQVRLGGGEARGGVEEDAAEAFLRTATAHAGIRFVGLMGVADPEMPARPQFARLRLLGERLSVCAIERAPLVELSMGMTGDFEDAIAEGATIVRIGTAIFGERPPRA